MAWIEERICFREPIEEIGAAAVLLASAQIAHLAERFDEASSLIHAAHMPAIRGWTESIWGASAQDIIQFRQVAGAPFKLVKGFVPKSRMPSKATMQKAVERDGLRCRYCGIPVIDARVRKSVIRQYPDAVTWARTNAQQHAAFQCMWLQYDHVFPFSRGGSNDINNIVVSCAPCNYGKMEYTLEEAGLADPRDRAPVRSEWDGLVGFLDS